MVAEKGHSEQVRWTFASGVKVRKQLFYWHVYWMKQFGYGARLALLSVVM